MSKSELIAICCALAGSCLWGIVWLPIAALDKMGVTGLWTTVLVFGLVGLAVLPLLIAAHRRGRCPLNRSATLLLFLFGGLTNFLFFLALAHTSVVRALMLFYLSPIWNLLAARFARGQRLTPRKLVVITISLIGAFVLLGLYRTDLFYWGRGDTFALGSGLAFAASVVALQRSPQTPSWALSAINWLGTATLAGLAIIILQPAPPSLANWTEWLPLLLFFAFGIQSSATLFILFSLTRLESYRVNVLMLFEIISGTISFALLSTRTVQPQEWLGITLIVSASLVDNLRLNRR